MATPFTVIGPQAISNEKLRELIEQAEAISRQLLPETLARQSRIRLSTHGTLVPLQWLPRESPDPLSVLRKLVGRITGGQVVVSEGLVSGSSAGYVFSFPAPIRVPGKQSGFLPILNAIVGGIVNIVAPGAGTGLVEPLLRIAEGEDPWPEGVPWESIGAAAAEVLMPGAGLVGRQIAALAEGKPPLQVLLPEVLSVAPGLISDLFGGIGNLFGIPGGETFGQTLEGGVDVLEKIGVPGLLFPAGAMTAGALQRAATPPILPGGTSVGLNDPAVLPPGLDGFTPQGPELSMVMPRRCLPRSSRPLCTLVRGSRAHWRRTSRRMNPLNVHALRRSLRRTKAATKLVKRLIHLPKMTIRGRGGKCPARRRRRPC